MEQIKNKKPELNKIVTSVLILLVISQTSGENSNN